MSTPTVIERIVALEPVTRDDFADPPTLAPTETGRKIGRRPGAATLAVIAAR